MINQEDVESGKFNWLNVIDVRSSSRLREYKRTTPAEVVWEMLLPPAKAPSTGPSSSPSSYRA